MLFIGNSLTASNNLPAMVEALSAIGGGPRIATRAVVFGGFSLEDHWRQGAARTAIATGRARVVVLQQGPSALPESQVSLREWTRRFDEEIRRSGARSALYMVWPSSERSFDFDGVAASYTRAAEDVGGLLLPAGEAWRAAWRRDPALPLYDRDGFHPSPLGTYLAALVAYQAVSGRSVIGLPPRLSSPSGQFPAIDLSPERARLLQDAAAEANAQFGPR